MKKFMNFDAIVKSAFNNDENDYAAFNKLLVDSYKGNVEGYSQKEANDKIVEVFRAAIGCDAHSTTKEIRQAIRRNQNVIFDLLEDVLQDMLVSGWQNDPFFQEYVDMRNLSLGDKNEFYVEDNSILSVSKLSGGNHDIIRQRLGAGTTFSVNTYWAGLKIYSEFERLATGAEDWAKFVSRVSDAYNRYIAEAMYDALITAGEALGSQWFKTSALSAATQETFRTLCMEVAMATGHEVCVMGTRVALANVFALQNVSWASNGMKDEFNQTGRFGYWEGIRLNTIGRGLRN